MNRDVDFFAHDCQQYLERWSDDVNKQLDDAITRVRTLPDEQQREAAQILLEFLDLQDTDMRLTPEQVAEIERRLSDDEPYATSEEVRDLYARLAK